MQQNMCEFDEFWNSSNSQLFLMVPSWLQLIFLSLNETLSQSLYDSFHSDVQEVTAEGRENLGSNTSMRRNTKLLVI